MMRSNSREHEDEDNNQHQHQHQHHHHIVNLNHEQQQEQEQQQQQRRSWTRAFGNPRIVRVSRTFGGKDRHSKVCTVRGLRDRRIRLSVMTAIQLYDLQDRLGLNQPSKVIDWLLQAAQNDVDLLPPLQFPPGFGFGFHQNYQSYNPENNQLGLFQSFDLGDCSSSSRKESLDILDKGKSIKFDNGFDIDHHYFPNSTQSHKLYNNNNNFPPDTAYNSSSHQYDINGHLQQSLLDQSSNVTVAFSNVHHHHHHTNINLNPPLPQPPPQPSHESQAFPATMTMSSLFPTYPSFLGAAQLQLFGSNSNNSKQRDI